MSAEPPPIDHDDDIEAYVLGTLSREEAAAFARRMASSPELRERVRQARAVARLLAESPVQLSPSPALRARVMAAVHADRDDAAAMPPPSPPAAMPPGETGPAAPTPIRQRTRAWGPWLATAAAILLALGLGGWNVLLQQQINQQQRRGATQQQEMERDRAALQALAAAERFWTMRGVPQYAPQATSLLALNRQEKQTVLVVKGFPPLPEGQTYQVWVILNDQPVPVGTFTPASIESEQALVVPSDLSGVTHAAITIEPAGGSPRPTGDIVMGGDL